VAHGAGRICMAITIEYKDAENKLLIMYLINMMELPMSRAQITDFIIEKELMHHFTLWQNLTEMVERGFLEATYENAQDENTTRYTLTEDGLTNLELLQNQIPRPARNLINQYVEKNRGKIKKGFEKTAHYFPNAETGEYDVKVGIIDDKSGANLMEIIVPVLTREQAKHIQANWNANYCELYQRILLILTDSV
jgi:DNA-binding PadR family transcriptional regulator